MNLLLFYRCAKRKPNAFNREAGVALPVTLRDEVYIAEEEKRVG